MGDLAKQRAFLIVEDERILALDLRRTLENKGFRVTASVFTGDDALRAAETSPPDVVFMDLRLKGPMDGIATAQALRSRFEFALVYVTGSVIDSDCSQRVLATRPIAWLAKPFSEAMLDDAVAAALDSLQDA